MCDCVRYFREIVETFNESELTLNDNFVCQAACDDDAQVRKHTNKTETHPLQCTVLL